MESTLEFVHQLVESLFHLTVDQILVHFNKNSIGSSLVNDS